MTKGGARVLQLVGQRIPVDDDTKQEILEIAKHRAATKGAIGKILEVASLLSLTLHLHYLSDTDDDRREIFTQAAVLGSSLVTIGTMAWVHAENQNAGSATLWATTSLLFAGLLVRSLPIRAGLLLLAGAIWLTLGSPSPSTTTGLVIGFSLGAAGCWSRNIKPSTRPGYLALGAAGAIGVCQVSTGLTLSTGLVTAVVAVFPAVLLIAGWFDPRYALAATAVWLWRLAAVDVVDLVFRANELGYDTELSVLALRWAIMGAGVIVGTAVSQRALERACTL